MRKNAQNNAIMICKNCGKSINFNNCLYCNECGSVFCEDCAKADLALCDCLGELRYYN
ncbi:MAG: hypothetical protein IJY70_06035 [Clostridia bacterium]|nr:hypothetical protein [Clostridia bacterium]